MSQKIVPMPLNLAEEGMDLIAAAGALDEKVAAEQVLVVQKAGLVADAVVKSGHVDPLDRARLEKQLADHVSTLDILARVAGNGQVRAMGRPEKAAAAAEDYLSRSKRESDRVFEEIIRSAGVGDW